MEKQKLCIVTDAWLPQVNGVVTTLTNIVKQAENEGWEVLVIYPGMFPNISAPKYPEIKLSWAWGIKKKIADFNPTHLHIATEGPLGLAARISFRREQYTTAYHTQWAPFLKDIIHLPKSITWKFIRWFHEHGKVMVPTPSIQEELVSQGIRSEVVLFSRGVDLTTLNPTIEHKHNKKPVLLSVGRVSVEKNLDVFCQLDKDKYDLVVVGDGPYLPKLKEKYPHVRFTGILRDVALANEYTYADCMVFTSVKDTFGIVIIESQCLGTPVAAYPVKGPIDVIQNSTGSMNFNLELAIEKALLLDRNECAKTARQQYSWSSSWQQFKANLVKH
jgi:glycosyltransferase involved in cell wall biosynthesis